MKSVDTPYTLPPLEGLLMQLRDSSQTEREKGTYFENLARAYLRNEDSFRELYSDVWTFAEWAKLERIDGKDTGIDLVARTRGTGETPAIQCKFYASDYRVQKSDIDSFFTASCKKPFSHQEGEPNGQSTPQEGGVPRERESVTTGDTIAVDPSPHHSEPSKAPRSSGILPAFGHPQSMVGARTGTPDRDGCRSSKRPEHQESLDELRNAYSVQFLGQLSFYVEALDRDVKKEHERPSIGVLLCATKDDEVVEYALASTTSPMLVAEYQTLLPPNAVLRQKLHELYAELVVEGPLP